MKTTLALICLSTAAVSGCVSPDNDRITIGRSLRLEAFTPSPIVDAPVRPSQVQVPSLTGVDRSNWESTLILVPVDGVAHRPTYSKQVLVTDKTRRQRREYPTYLSALDLYGGSQTQQELEAVYNQLIAASDYVLLLPRTLWTRPWATRWSASEAYQRYWHPERPEPEPVPQEGEPFSEPRPQPVTP